GFGRYRLLSGADSGERVAGRYDEAVGTERPGTGIPVSGTTDPCTGRVNTVRVGFRKSAAGLARGTLVNVSGVRGPVLVGEVLVDELDRSGVVAAVAAELAAKRVVELVDIDPVESAVVGDVPLEFKRDILPVSERACTLGLG